MNILKQKLSKRIPTVGSWITLAHPGVAEIMAKSGFDWLTIDLEHTSITLREAEDLIRTIDLLNVAPLVRLTNNDPNLIKRVMDMGAHGIIVPMVNSRIEAEAAVNSVYYPPRGKRGVGLGRAQGYGSNFSGYLKNITESLPTIIVQIEHIHAVDNFKDILSVDGIDGFIIGPYDLSSSLGFPGQFDHPKMMDAISKINQIAKTSNKVGGYHIVEPRPDLLIEKIKEGYLFNAYSEDIRILDTECRRGLAEIKNKIF